MKKNKKKNYNKITDENENLLESKNKYDNLKNIN